MSRFFFFNDTATTEIYTLSLHDALPIWGLRRSRELVEQIVQVGSERFVRRQEPEIGIERRRHGVVVAGPRSEEHTSELQSRPHLVCRLLLANKKEVPAATLTRRLPSIAI